MNYTNRICLQCIYALLLIDSVGVANSCFLVLIEMKVWNQRLGTKGDFSHNCLVFTKKECCWQSERTALCTTTCRIYLQILASLFNFISSLYQVPRPCFDPRFFALKSTQQTNEKIELQSHPIQSTLTHVCMCGVNDMMIGEVLLKLYGLKWQTGSGGILTLFFDWLECPPL